MRLFILLAASLCLAACAADEPGAGIVIFTPDDAPPNPYLGDDCEPRGEESFGWDDWTCTNVTGSRAVSGHRARGDGRTYVPPEAAEG